MGNGDGRGGGGERGECTHIMQGRSCMAVMMLIQPVGRAGLAGGGKCISVILVVARQHPFTQLKLQNILLGGGRPAQKSRSDEDRFTLCTRLVLSPSAHL